MMLRCLRDGVCTVVLLSLLGAGGCVAELFLDESASDGMDDPTTELPGPSTGPLSSTMGEDGDGSEQTRSDSASSMGQDGGSTTTSRPTSMSTGMTSVDATSSFGHSSESMTTSDAPPTGCDPLPVGDCLELSEECVWIGPEGGGECIENPCGGLTDCDEIGLKDCFVLEPCVWIGPEEGGACVMRLCVACAEYGDDETACVDAPHCFWGADLLTCQSYV